jgi:hypothetical protein
MQKKLKHQLVTRIKAKKVLFIMKKILFLLSFNILKEFYNG